MLEKLEYYHGAAIIRLLEDERCGDIKRHKLLGYVVNLHTFILLKYSTKGRSPWGFTFDQEDVDRASRVAADYQRVILGLICGGDGICAINWEEGRRLLADQPGRIAVGRKHNHSYSVWGTAGELKWKVPVNRWPSLVFDQMQNTTASLLKTQ